MNRETLIQSVVGIKNIIVNNYRKKFITLIIFSCINGAIDAATLLLVLPIIQKISSDSSESFINSASKLQIKGDGWQFNGKIIEYLVIFIVLICVKSLNIKFRDQLTNVMRIEIIGHLRRRLFNGFAGASWGYISKVKSSELSSVILSEIDRVNQGLSLFLEVPSRLLTIIVNFLIAFLVSPRFFAIATLLAFLMAWFMRKKMLISSSLGKSITDANRSIYNEVTEFIGGIKLLKSHGIESRQVVLFAENVDRADVDIIRYINQIIDARFIQDISAILVLFTFFISGYYILSVPVNRLILLIFIFYRVFPLVQDFQQIYQRILSLAPAMAAVIDMCVRCEREKEHLWIHDGVRVSFEKHIKFLNVSFSHDGRKDIIRNASFIIEKNKLTVICGASGAGKSSVLDLVVGLISPTKGTILIDDVILDCRIMSDWRGGVSYVNQDTFLFNGTIQENLLWMHPDATLDELMVALRQAAAEFVFDLPKALDTIVGDRGASFSGGERQRLALARAILRKPKLLILDEATSALDPESERMVLNSIDILRGSMTILMVTHKLSSQTRPDRAILIKNGLVQVLN